jgi:hypothetical protein
MFCIEFLVAFQIQITLHVTHRKQVADLWADRIAESSAGAAICGQLLISIADQPDVHLLGNELGDSPIEVAINPVLIIETRIDEVVREAGYRGKFPACLLIEIGVAGATID